MSPSRRAALVVILSGFAVFAPEASAQASRILWWSGTFDDAFVEAKNRNVPLVFVFIQDGEEANERVVSGVFSDNDYVKAMKEAVPVVLSHEVHGLREDVVDGVRVGVCKKFGGCPCASHKELEAEARAEFVGMEVLTPQHVFVLPDKTVFDRMVDVFAPSAYADTLRRAQKKLGRGVGREPYRTALQKTEAGRKLLDEEKWNEAAKTLDEALAIVQGTPKAAIIEELTGRIDAAADARLKNVAAAETEGDFYRALRACEEGLADFADHKKKADFKKEQERLSKLPKGREAARLLAKEARARPSFDAAVAAVEAKEFVKAKRDFERAEKLAEGTPLAKEARRRLDAMTADPDVQAILERADREAAADEALKTADALLRAGDSAGAKAELTRILERFAGTRAAEGARKRLAELK
jgi:tetratricopeptide (TPR) repeat protein